MVTSFLTKGMFKSILDSRSPAVLRQSAIAFGVISKRPLSSTSLNRSESTSEPSFSSSSTSSTEQSSPIQTSSPPSSSISSSSTPDITSPGTAPASFSIPSKIDPNNVKIVHYPFYIRRTHPGGNLPVYSVYKQHRCETLIRKIDGDGQYLCFELQKHFPKVSYNKLTNQVTIQGHHVEEVKKRLASYGF